MSRKHINTGPTGCPAVLNVAGEHFDCDWPTYPHDGWAHSNEAAQALWLDDRNTAHPKPGMRPRRLRRLLALSLFGAILSGTGLGYATDARADDLSGCQDDFWFTFGSTRRVLCDGVTRPDGSWLRAREFYTPAHQVPLQTSCYGTYYISCTTSGGYWQERLSKGVETYIVTPDTVLPDEPGHLVNGYVA